MKRKIKRKERQKHNAGKILLILISFLFAAVLALLLFLRKEEAEKSPVYETVSMSEEAAARAYIWLNQIEDMPLSYTEIKQMMGEIRLTLILTKTEEKGKYNRTLAEGTIAECQKQAQAGFEKAYREVVRHRILASGYAESISDEGLDEKMMEIYGMSVSEYLLSCDVQLLPEPKELAEVYCGEVAYE